MLFPLLILAQKVEVTGTVYDSTGARPITNKKVHIYVSGSVPYNKTVFTNAAGAYKDSLPANVIDGVLRVSIDNCYKLRTLRQTQLTNSTQNVFVFNFDYCPDGCNASIAYVGGGPISGSPPTGTIELSCLTDGQGPFHYAWNLNGLPGDTTQMTTFQYTNTGRLEACVTLTDSKLCKDSTCKRIDYGELQNIVGELQGIIKLNNGDFTDYVLELHRQQEDGSVELHDEDTIFGSPGRYHFRNVPAGAYYLRAEVLPFNAEYDDFFPTYLGNDILWFQSTALVINGVIQGKDFVFTPKNPMPQGQSRISGHVADKNGSAAVDIPVILFDSQNSPVEIEYTDNNGRFSFSQVSEGSYRLYPDYLGFTAIPGEVEVSSGNDSENNDFQVVNNYVRPAEDLGINSLLESEVSIYPNPFFGFLCIDNQSVEKRIEKISVFDPMFRVICSYRVNEEEEQRVLLETENWESGTYLVQVFYQKQSTPEAHIFFKR